MRACADIYFALKLMKSLIISRCDFAVIQAWFEYIDVESVECGSTKTGRFTEWLVQRR